MKITNLDDTLKLIPEYWPLVPLVPGVDKWKEEDEFYLGTYWAICKFKLDKFTYAGKKEFVRLFRGEWGWTDLIKNEKVNVDVARRPIPLEIQTQEARWILATELLDRRDISALEWLLLRRTAESKSRYVEKEMGHAGHGEILKRLGGADAAVEMLTLGPGALWRWIAESRT